jgi:hypothetical protein
MLRWDGGLASLSATLYQARPEVFPPSDAAPIPLGPSIPLHKGDKNLIESMNLVSFC